MSMGYLILTSIIALGTPREDGGSRIDVARFIKKCHRRVGRSMISRITNFIQKYTARNWELAVVVTSCTF